MEKYRSISMKYLRTILPTMLLISLSACAGTLNSPAVHFRKFVENRVLCMDTVGVVEYGGFLRKNAKSVGFEIIELSREKKNGPMFDDYEVLLKQKTREIKILGFEILAVYSDPTDRQNFSALLRANRNDIISAIEKNNIKMRQIDLTQFVTPLIRGGYPPPWAIEIENCDESGKNENISNICKLFGKPATWIGCVYEQNKTYF